MTDSRASARPSAPPWAARCRPIGFVLAIVFGAVGLAFILTPDGVLGLFNAVSRPLGMREAPPEGAAFFRILAIAYMYVVTALAVLMVRRPGDRLVVSLLIQAKAVSALVSLGFFVLHAPYLVYLANAVCDGLIAAGLGALWLALGERTP